MSDEKANWKEDHINALKESLAFFSNKEKLNREKWTVKRLLRALAIDFREEELTGAEEPVDVSFRDARFQEKEILDEDRRRTDEYKKALKKAEAANNYSELLELYDPIDISFSEVVQKCYDYARTLLLQSKYGPLECKNIDLICYFNLANHHVVPPVDVLNEKIGFRSLSVVSNRYCAVAYAAKNAPKILRDNVGKAKEYFEL
jgi:uncharacterized Fe-S cluster-containing protein